MDSEPSAMRIQVPASLMEASGDLTPAQPHRMARELAESDQMFRALFEAAPDAILWMSGSKFIGCNRRSEVVFGCSQGELLLRTPEELSPPIQPNGEPSVLLAGRMIQAAMEGTRQSFEWQHQRMDGTPFLADVTLTRTEIGGETFLQAIVRDISHRKLAEETLKASEERYRCLLENLGEGIIHVDETETVLFANPAAERIFGVDGGLGGHSLREFLTQEAFETIQEHSRLRELGAGSTYQIQIRRPGGEKRTILITGTPNRDDQGRPTGTLGILRDITRESELEAQLRHSQKMEAIGVMAGGIAHDFNNLLMPILCYAEMAKNRTCPPDRMLAYMDQIEMAARRARDLVQHLLSFSRSREQEATAVRLGPVVKECLKLMRAALPANIEIRQDIEDTGHVHCVAGHIH